MRSAFLLLALYATPLAAATLEGLASLEAGTLAPGPVSGAYIGEQPQAELPFQGQPVQGFSAIIRDGEGGLLALTDNGFGSRENSADFLLRVYSIEADFRTATGGTGRIHVNGFATLSDPGSRFHHPIQAETESDPEKRELRLLTGADLDPESMRQAPDGSLWIGDEFGPYLLHFDTDGQLLGAPLTLAGLSAQDGPEDCCGTATLARSRGFEGMAITPSGKYLYPMLEGSVAGQEGQLNIYRFDIETGAYLSAHATLPAFRYRLETGATAIGDFTLYSETAGFIIERDSQEGPEARLKKVFRVDFERLDTDGFLVKEEVADLLLIADPHDLDGDGKTLFRFPHKTPEALIVIDSDTIGIINDNNFPFGRARHPGGDSPDSTEFILLRIDSGR